MTSELKPFPGYENWNESSMANKFIAYWDMHDVRVSPEVHYNNYGTRGVVDLYQHAGKIAYELKSENAVKSVSGANAIVRQYNKMREKVRGVNQKWAEKAGIADVVYGGDDE